MDDYIKKYESFDKMLVYDYTFGSGGLGDYIKYFIELIHICIHYNYRIYYLINSNPIEKYVRLKYENMYITNEIIFNNKTNIIRANEIKKIKPNIFYMIKPFHMYNNTIQNNINIQYNEIFYFSNDIIINSSKLLNINNKYISLHLRLGDKYLETDKQYINKKQDTRYYNEENIYNFIENNKEKNIIFFCDNNDYKIKLKNKYNNIIITKAEIGHISFINTTDKQFLDSITEFYILTNSEHIYCASNSGFSLVASKFLNIPISYLY
jgi:hypothetical protein